MWLHYGTGAEEVDGVTATELRRRGFGEASDAPNSDTLRIFVDCYRSSKDGERWYMVRRQTSGGGVQRIDLSGSTLQMQRANYCVVWASGAHSATTPMTEAEAQAYLSRRP